MLPKSRESYPVCVWFPQMHRIFQAKGRLGSLIFIYLQSSENTSEMLFEKNEVAISCSSFSVFLLTLDI